MDHHPKPKTAYCDCICQLLRAEFCRKLAFPGHPPAVRYSEFILRVGCARSALGCSSAKRSRSLLRGSSTSRHPTFGDIATGVFTPVLAKHSKSFSLVDCISVSVDRMQRNFEPMRKQVETWQQSELTDVTAKVVISEAFVEGRLEAPKHLARTVHDFTSKGSTRSSSQGQSGVSRMHLLPYPRNWTRFRSSRRQRSWANTSKPGSQNRSRQDCSVAMNQGLF